MKDKFLSIEEASAILNVSTKTLRKWDDEGKLIANRTAGGHRRYDPESIKKFNYKSGIFNAIGDPREEYKILYNEVFVKGSPQEYLTEFFKQNLRDKISTTIPFDWKNQNLNLEPSDVDFKKFRVSINNKHRFEQWEFIKFLPEIYSAALEFHVIQTIKEYENNIHILPNEKIGNLNFLYDIENKHEWRRGYFFMHKDAYFRILSETPAKYHQFIYHNSDHFKIVKTSYLETDKLLYKDISLWNVYNLNISWDYSPTNTTIGITFNLLSTDINVKWGE